MSKDQDSKDSDEDISIDFSWLKNLFKKKGTHHHAAHEPRHEGNTDHPAHHEASDDEELNFDFKKASAFFMKITPLLLILIPVILGIAIRAANMNMPITDSWAQSSVEGFYRNQISGAIDTQYPNLPAANRATIVETEFARYRTQNKAKIDSEIKQISDQFKDGYRDEDGHLFIPDIDPYFWYRYAKNIVDHGHPGDLLVDGKPYDNHMLAPIGKVVAPDMFHAYYLAFQYPIVKFFKPSDTLLDSIAYYPLVVVTLTLILIFFIGKKIAGNMGGLFAATFAAVTVSYVNRTLFGHADSDAWVVFFSVAITWCYLMAMDSKTLFPRIAFSVLTGIFVGMFKWAWSGWWFMFTFVLLTTTAYLCIYLVLHIKELKKGLWHFLKTPAIRNTLLILVIIFAMSAASVTVAESFEEFMSFPGYVFGTPSIKDAVRSGTLWPNVLTTVAELNPGTVDAVIGQFGGKIIYVIALMGIAVTLIPKRLKTSVKVGYLGLSVAWFIMLTTPSLVQMNPVTYLVLLTLPVIAGLLLMFYAQDTSMDPKHAILLTLWFVATIYATIKGIRFTILLVPAFSIAFGVAISGITNWSSGFLAKELKLRKAIIATVLVMLFGILLIGPAQASLSVSKGDVPIVNSAWYNSLRAINASSEKNAIINSWWDFGHHFKALADRAVTFDGTTQHTPQAHWIGKVLLTDNEDQAIGILRMLDCGANRAFDTIFALTNDYHTSLGIIYTIIEMDKATAQNYLNSRFGPLDTAKILQYTHCDPPEDYFIASDDMVGKSGVWAHFGSWNFTRADIYKNTKHLDVTDATTYMEKHFNYTKDEAEKTYYEVQALPNEVEANAWISPWPGYVSGITQCQVKGDIADCGNGLTVNLTTNEPTLTTPQGNMKPAAFAYADKEGVQLKQYNTTFPYGAALVPQGEGYAAVFMDPKLTGSMFTVMYFYRGHGLRYFTPFTQQQHFTGTKVFTYKVDWAGKKKNVISEFKNETPVINESVEKTETKAGDTVSVEYLGKLEDGTIFDSSIDGWKDLGDIQGLEGYSHTPFEFTLGSGRVLPLFDAGITGMSLNETKTITVPAGQGYPSGELGNKTLIFTVKVVKIK